MAISFDTLYQARGEEDGLIARNQQIIALNNRLKSNVQHIDDLSPGTPMAVRKLITAQLNAHADNGENVRSRTAFHCTIGWALTMTARILRVAVRTLGLPISLCVAAFQQSRYGQYNLNHNLVAEDLRSVGREWFDLGVTLFAVPVIGFVNTLAPTAISTRRLAEFYSERITQTAERNHNFTAARDAYYAAQQQQHAAWRAAQQAE